MEIYKIQNLTFTYPERSFPALCNLNFTIQRGQFVLLMGPSGCGKTSLLKRLKPTFAPHGEVSGKIYFEGAPLEALGKKKEATKIGFVQQNPDNQIVTAKVWHELAFGLESLGCATPSIRLRVAEMASFFGIQTWFHKNVAELSGGQKQLLNLASIMAMQPTVLILDEPTGQLDPIAASEFLAAVSRINRELGLTVLMTEHRLEEVFPLADRVIAMDQGHIIAAGAPPEIGAALRDKSHGLFYSLPVPVRVYAALENGSTCPVTVRGGRNWLDQQKICREHFGTEAGTVGERFWTGAGTAGEHFSTGAGTKKRALKEETTSVEFQEVWFRYEKELPDILKGLSFKAYAGEITAILGGTGSGKTTMLSLLGGINRPYRGKVQIEGQSPEKINGLFDGLLGVLPQNPQTLFVCKTVEEDLWEMFAGSGIGKAEKAERAERAERVQHVISICRLKELLRFHPYDLSGGEQQRAALAKVLLLKPRLLLLDEPTKGLDAEFKLAFAKILRRLADAGTTVIMVSHDLEFCAEHADRCALFFDGSIISINKPRSFFAGNSFYTTAANRMARHLLPAAITARDIVVALDGDPAVLAPPTPDNDCGNDAHATGTKVSGVEENKTGSTPVVQPVVQADLKIQANRGKQGLSKRTLAAAAMILLAIPLTIYAGLTFWGDRKYYFISLLIILETMLPFALAFEKRKPQARELVTIAVLCASGVAGRTVFFMLPQVKPVTAIVIIAGVALGGETGFLVGAMTGFVSNIFFGQGPWTPWQMFSYGIIGFLAGILSRKGILKRNRAALSIYGGLATLFIYGPLINSSYIFTYQSNPTPEMFYLAILQGLPFDLVHAATTILFLLLISDPMLEKLERIKLKYGLLEANRNN